MLFLAKIIATIINCSHTDRLQQQYQPQLLFFVVCVVIVSIWIVISLKKCQNSVKNSQKHQQQQGKLYELIENEYLIATSNHVIRIRLQPNMCFLNLHYCESQQRSEQLVEITKTSTHATVVSSLTVSIHILLKRLNHVCFLLWTLFTNHLYLIYLVSKIVISFYIFFTTFTLDVPKNGYYFYFVFILLMILWYLLFNIFTNLMFISYKQSVPCCIISFVPSRIYESTFRFCL